MSLPLIISNKGNILQRELDNENKLRYIESAMRKYAVEIDVFLLDNDFLSLSENPEDVIDESFLETNKIFTRCMSEGCFERLSENLNIQCFYLGDDFEAYISNSSLVRNASDNKMVSKNRIITFSGTYDEFKNVYKTAIVPYGICTDHPESFRVGFSKEVSSFNEDDNQPQRISLTQFVKDIQTKDWRTA